MVIPLADFYHHNMRGGMLMVRIWFPVNAFCSGGFGVIESQSGVCI